MALFVCPITTITHNVYMKLSDALVGYWLEKRLHMSPTTIPGYERTFARLIVFLGDVDIEHVTANDVRRFLAWLPQRYQLSRRTVHDAWIPLSSLWTWAAAELDIPHIMRGKVKQPTFTRRQIDPFTREDVQRIVNACGADGRGARPTVLRDRAIVFVLLDSGLRASELCDLRVVDCEVERGRLHVAHGKMDKERFVTVGNRTRRALWRYLVSRGELRPVDWLFVTNRGTSMQRNSLSQMLQRIGDRAGVPHVHAHRFRHTFAITFLRNGGDLLTLQHLLGHESMAMVRNYVKLAGADIDRAARHSPADGWHL
jgi:site-specific recombinase XerD